MTKSILFLAVPVLGLFADPIPKPEPCESKIKYTPVDLQGRYQIRDAYGVTVSGSALFWKPYEEGLDYAIQNVGATAVNNDGMVKRPRFDWNWGSRINFGYEIPREKMDLDLSWTWYTSSGTVSSNVTSPTTLFSVWSLPNLAGNAYEYQSTAHTHLIFNRIDLGMSGTFAPRSFLELTPLIDLSALWIHQKFDFNLSGGPGINGRSVVDDKIAMKNNFFGIGPKLGINTLWNLGYGLGIFGNFDLSLLYGFFDISQSEIVTFTGTGPNTYLDLPSNSYHDPRMNFDLMLGLSWDWMFACGKYHLHLDAGWENSIFLGQNQLMRFTSTTYPGINNLVKGDLSLQGLTMRALFTF